MASIREPRTRLAGAVATVVLAALCLTACDDGTGVRHEGAPAGGSTTASPYEGAPSADMSTPGGSASPSAKTPAAPAGSRQPGDTATTRSPASGGKPVTCEGSDTRTVAAPLNRPVNHMLLTVTNTGNRACYLYAYPALRFTDAQAVPPVVADSHPQAVVTLNPGESGYASVNLSAADGSGANGRTVTSLTVYFYGRSGSGSVGAAAHPPLPAKGLYIDDSLRTTYWQQSMDDALAW